MSDIGLPMFDFAYLWPWIGAALAAVLLALLFGTSLFRTPGAPSRWHDTAWLAVLSIPLYMVHQVEEHGIDLYGQTYAFRAALCAQLGYPDPFNCGIPVAFITAVNVGSVWGATVLAAVFGRRNPLIALSAYGIPLVNAVAHIAESIRGGYYNPGLLTGTVLFLPVSLWALHAGRQSGIGRRGIAAIVASGVLVHVVLMGSLLAYLHGAFGAGLLVVIQILNALVPLAVVSAINSLARRRPRRLLA
jgi:hypothetical protein